MTAKALAALLTAAGAASLTGCDRSAEAAAPRLARPAFAAASAPPRLDLTRVMAAGGRASLARLSKDPAICREALAAVGAAYADLPPAREADADLSGVCGFDDAVRIDAGLTPYSQPLAATCALAARLYVWEFEVLAPAAERHFGVELAGVETLGGYSCRRRSGDGQLSRHAFAEAADIAGFRLADGRVIRVEESYWTQGPARDFLREAHAGACGLFDVTLGPGYNAEHADHFHVDVGGQSACR